MELITSKQVLDILGCSSSTLRRYIARGVLHPCKKSGGKNYFSEESIRNFIPPSQIGQGLQGSQMREIIDKWGVNKLDTSSADVQIGVYTEKIAETELEMKGYSPNDRAFPQLRKLLVKYICERRRLLNYLESTNYSRYRRAIKIIQEQNML